MRPIASCGLVLALAQAACAEFLVTVRLGEQDTCSITGVTALRWDAQAGLSRLRFDVSQLPAGGGVRQALLRFWVPATSEGSPHYRQWGPPRWKDARFDGFKVYRGPAPAADALLDTKYPFQVPTYWCFEFDVTEAVRQWAAEPEKNTGLCANFAFPVAPDAEPAWQRPYLQVTCTGPNPDRPAQPTRLAALYRGGQVFLTWTQRPHEGAFFDAAFRVYQHDEPITAGSLGGARLLGEVHRLSQLNYRRTLTARGGDYGPWRHYLSAAGQEAEIEGESRQERFARVRRVVARRFNFVIDADWPERTEGGRFLKQPTESEKVQLHQGPQLADDTGLFVHTVAAAGRRYYAVTSVRNGNENRQDFSAGNAPARPVEQKPDRPRPVLQAVFTANGPEGYRKVGKFQVREYVYWAGSDGRCHTEPSTPFAFCFHVPRRWVGLGHAHNEDRDRPPWIVSNAKVAGYSVHYWNGDGLVMDTGYVPPTRLAPFPPGRSSNMTWEQYARLYHGTARAPDGGGEPGPWWFCRNVFGYVETLNSGADPRRAIVRPFFEDRRLLELGFVLSSFPADANYVAAVGEGAAMNFGIHHAEQIGCVKTAQERPWNSPRGIEAAEPLVGERAWGLKTPEGHDVWQWNDPVWLSRQFPGTPWPCISNTHSDNYDGADNWRALGFPRFYLDVAAERRVQQLWWCDIGDAPAGQLLEVPVNQAYPVLSNVTCAQTPAESWKDEPRGSLNGYVVWHRPTRPWMTPLAEDAIEKLRKAGRLPEKPAGATVAYEDGRTVRWAAVPLDLVDEPGRFEVALRIGEEGMMLNGQSVPPCRVACGAGDVTLRRVQRFRIEPGRQYAWRNVKAASGAVLQAGTVTPDDRGRLTVPQVFLDKDVLGNKLIVAPAGGLEVPVVDRRQQVRLLYFPSSGDRRTGRNEHVEELSYEQYVARCLRPELVPVVRAGKTFAVDDFVNSRGFRDGGLYSMWGGGFDDSFVFGRGGRYRVEVETTRAYFQNGAWPILDLSIDDGPQGDRLLDSNEPLVSTWWIDVSPGRHRVRFRLANNVFNEPVDRNGDQSPKPDRGFTVLGVRFVPLGQAPQAAGEVHQVRIRQRSLLVPPGMAMRLAADVLDSWGRPAGAEVRWRADRQECVGADGLFRADRPGEVRVTASAGGRSDTVAVTVAGEEWVEDFDDEWPDGWQAVALGGGEKPGLWTVTRKTGFIGAMVQRGDAGRCGMVWSAGRDWSDLSVTADLLPAGQGLPGGGTAGVLFRYVDERNCCRFEKRPAKDGATFRLVAVADGKETVLAEATKSIPPLAVPRKTCRSLRHWSQRWKDEPDPLRIDRFEMTVRGRRITAGLNGTPLFAVEHDAPPKGTIGLYCEGAAAFDNVTVTPP